MELLIKIIFVALWASFALLLANKQGVIERMQVHGNDFFNKMASCQFCLSFWANVIVCIICVIVSICIGKFDYTFFLTPVMSTPITRKLL